MCRRAEALSSRVWRIDLREVRESDGGTTLRRSSGRASCAKKRCAARCRSIDPAAFRMRGGEVERTPAGQAGPYRKEKGKKAKRESGSELHQFECRSKHWRGLRHPQQRPYRHHTMFSGRRLRQLAAQPAAIFLIRTLPSNKLGICDSITGAKGVRGISQSAKERRTKMPYTERLSSQLLCLEHEV